MRYSMHRNHRHILFARILSPFLIGGLTLGPSPAYALRPTLEGPAKTGLESALHGDAQADETNPTNSKESWPTLSSVSERFIRARRLSEVHEALAAAVTSPQGIFGKNCFRLAHLRLADPAHPVQTEQKRRHNVALVDDRGLNWELFAAGGEPGPQEEGDPFRTRRVLEMLGEQALLALENVEAYNFSQMSTQVERITDLVHDVKNAAQLVSVGAERFLFGVELPPPNVDQLIERIQQAASDLATISSAFLETARLRMQRLESRSSGEPSAAQLTTLPASYAELFQRATLEFLRIVRDGNEDDLSKTYERFLERAQDLGNDPSARQILERFQTISSQALASVKELEGDEVLLRLHYSDLRQEYRNVASLANQLSTSNAKQLSGDERRRKILENISLALVDAQHVLRETGLLLGVLQEGDHAAEELFAEPANGKRLLSEILSEHVAFYSDSFQGKGHREISYEEGMPSQPALIPTSYDRNILLAALNNLLLNSLRHREPGRPLEVMVATSWDAERNELTVSVKDNGPGIPPELREQIFNGEGKAAGWENSSRVGLRGLQRRLRERGGDVWLPGNQPAVGSEFQFRLPLESVDGGITPIARQPAPPAVSRPTDQSSSSFRNALSQRYADVGITLNPKFLDELLAPGPAAEPNPSPPKTGVESSDLPAPPSPGPVDEQLRDLQRKVGASVERELNRSAWLGWAGRYWGLRWIRNELGIGFWVDNTPLGALALSRLYLYEDHWIMRIHRGRERRGFDLVKGEGADWWLSTTLKPSGTPVLFSVERSGRKIIGLSRPSAALPRKGSAPAVYVPLKGEVSETDLRRLVGAATRAVKFNRRFLEGLMEQDPQENLLCRYRSSQGQELYTVLNTTQMGSGELAPSVARPFEYGGGSADLFFQVLAYDGLLKQGSRLVQKLLYPERSAQAPSSGLPIFRWSEGVFLSPDAFPDAIGSFLREHAGSIQQVLLNRGEDRIFFRFGENGNSVAAFYLASGAGSGHWEVDPLDEVVDMEPSPAGDRLWLLVRDTHWAQPRWKLQGRSLPWAENEPREIPLHPPYSSARPMEVVLSPDGRLAYVAYDQIHDIQVYDLGAGEKSQPVFEPRYHLTHAGSAQGKQMVAGVDGTLFVVQEGERITAYNREGVPVRHYALQTGRPENFHIAGIGLTSDGRLSALARSSFGSLTYYVERPGTTPAGLEAAEKERLLQQAREVVRRGGMDPSLAAPLLKEIERDIRSLDTISASSGIYPTHLQGAFDLLAPVSDPNDYAVGIRFLVELALVHTQLNWMEPDTQRALREHGFSEALRFWKPIPDSNYQTAPLYVLPTLHMNFAHVAGEKAARESRRLVRKGRAHSMINVWTQEPRLAWKEKNHPLRSKVISELAARLGSNHVEIQIPPLHERQALARHIGAQPAQITLSRLASDYLTEDEAVSIKGLGSADAYRSVTRQFLVALFLRIYDMHRYNLNHLRDNQKYRTMWYDSEQGLHPDMESVDRYTVLFFRHFFLGPGVQISPEYFTSVLSIPEISAAAAAIQQADLKEILEETLYDLPEDFLQTFSAEQTLMQEYLPRLERWQGTFRADADRFFRLIFYYLRHPDQFQHQWNYTSGNVEILSEAELSEVDGDPTLRAVRQALGTAAGVEGLREELRAAGFGEKAARLTSQDLHSLRYYPNVLETLLDLYLRALELSVSPTDRTTLLDVLRRRSYQPQSLALPESLARPWSTLLASPDEEQFNRNLDAMEAAIRRFLEDGPAPDEVKPYLPRQSLPRWVEPAPTPQQREILRTILRRLLAAFDPQAPGWEIESEAAWWVDITKGASLRAMAERIREWRVPFGERFLRDFKEFAGDLLVAPAFTKNTGRNVELVALSFSDLPGASGGWVMLAAHEYAHGLISTRSAMDWNPLRIEHSPEDWIANAASVILGDWIASEPPAREGDWMDAVGMGAATSRWLYEEGRRLARRPTDRWVSTLAGYDFPSKFQFYGQGIVIGGIARELGEQIAQAQPSANPYERALRFIAVYATQAEDQNNKLPELARLARKFRKENGLSEEYSAGVEAYDPDEVATRLVKALVEEGYFGEVVLTLAKASDLLGGAPTVSTLSRNGRLVEAINRAIKPKLQGTALVGVFIDSTYKLSVDRKISTAIFRLWGREELPTDANIAKESGVSLETLRVRERASPKLAAFLKETREEVKLRTERELEVEKFLAHALLGAMQSVPPEVLSAVKKAKSLKELRALMKPYDSTAQLEIPSGGLEMDGLTVKETGQVAVGLEAVLEPGEKEIAVPLANQQMVRTLFRHPGIRELQGGLEEAGIQILDLENPAFSRELLSAEAGEGDLVLLPPGATVAEWIPALLRAPVVIAPASVLAGMEERQFAALAEVARAHGGLLEIQAITQTGLEEKEILILQMS